MLCVEKGGRRVFARYQQCVLTLPHSSEVRVRLLRISLVSLVRYQCVLYAVQVALDMMEPWRSMRNVARVLRVDGRVTVYLPKYVHPVIVKCRLCIRFAATQGCNTFSSCSVSQVLSLLRCIHDEQLPFAYERSMEVSNRFSFPTMLFSCTWLRCQRFHIVERGVDLIGRMIHFAYTCRSLTDGGRLHRQGGMYRRGKISRQLLLFQRRESCYVCRKCSRSLERSPEESKVEEGEPAAEKQLLWLARPSHEQDTHTGMHSIRNFCA